MPLEYLPAQRKGKSQLCVDSFLYNVDKPYDDRTTWECEFRKKQKCRARVITKGDEVDSRSGEHNHEADLSRLEGKRKLAELRRRAATSMDPARVIVSQGVKNVPPSVAAAMPSEFSINRSINRVRNASANAPANPPSMAALVIPDEYTKGHDDGVFLRVDIGAGNDRILVFCSDSGFELLSNSPQWFLDGTFKSAPPLADQLYTIHALIDDQVVVCAYALLQNRRKETYVRLFEALKALPGGNHLTPQQALVDFEVGAVKALEQCFPNIEVKGCYFHQSQSCWRKLQDLGLQDRYRSDRDFQNLCKLVPALAFVPLRELSQAFQEVSAEIFNQVGHDLDQYLDYFERVYIGRTIGGRFQPPLFAPQLWSQFDNTVEGLPRTNNSVEGWHRAFQSATGNHPTIWKFIDAVRDEDSLVNFRRNQINAGHPPPPKRRRYQDQDGRIANRVGRFNQHNTLTYLRGISYNVHF